MALDPSRSVRPVSRRHFLTGTTAYLAATSLLAACGGGVTATTAATSSPAAVSATSAATSLATTLPATTEAASVTTSSTAVTSTAQAAASGAPSKVQGIVRVLWQDPTPFAGWKPIWESTFAGFAQEHPGVTVQPTWITGDRNTKIIAMVAAGDPGDLFWTNNASSMHEFSARKTDRPLDDLVATSKYDLTQHYARSIAINRYQDKLYGMPTDSHAGISAVLYNADALTQAGVATPGPTWSYDDMVAAAAKLTVPSGAKQMFGMVGFESWYSWLSLMYSWGADVLNAQGTASTAKSAKSVSAFQWTDSLFHKFNVVPDPATESKLKGAIAMFTGGTAAMMTAGYWYIASMAKAAQGLSWKALPMPTGPGGRFTGYAANDNLSLFSTSKQVEAAWEYILYWMRDDVMIQLVQIGLNPASKPSVNNNPVLTKVPFYDAVKVFVNQLESGKYDSIPTPANQLQSEVVTALSTAISALWAGKVGVNGVLETLDQQLTATIAKPLPT
jgi:multiple sugar transport system substrate-binding protein